MGRKAKLEARLRKLEEKRAQLIKRSDESTDIEEVRSIAERLRDIAEEMDDIRTEIAAIDAEPKQRDDAPAFDPAKTTVVATATAADTRSAADPYGTEEYRMAFKAFVQRGEKLPEKFAKRTEGTTWTGDIGAIIPTTVMNELIKNVSKSYGQVYAKVRKLNVQGGIKFPISDLKAEFKWITESTVSPRQKAGTINDYVEFSYNIGEVRIAQTLLTSIVALPVFEAELTNILTAAWIEAVEKGIFSGTGIGQMLGILNDSRITNTITLTAADMADWAAWRKKLFSVIPLSKRGEGEFVFPASTVESYLLTMQDGNGRPIFREATELTVTDSNTAGKFFGRDVTLVEPDVIPDYDTAARGDVIGVYWVPSDYAINTQLAFGIKRYTDEESNQIITKGLTVLDGKMLDTAGCYLIKKG